MNLLSLSASGIATLIAMVGLPSSSCTPSFLSGPSPASPTAMASSIQINQSLTSHSQINRLNRNYSGLKK